MRVWLAIAVLAAAAIAFALLTGGSRAAAGLPLPKPADVGEYAFISGSSAPPSEAQCETVGRRCFTPQAIQAAYDMNPLYNNGDEGQGVTIAIIDSYGSDTIANDLHVFDTAFGLQPMCGEADVTCTSDMPTFSQLGLQGTPATKAPPSKSKGTGLENHAAWALEVSLDVEHAHAVAPKANILLVTTPTAETLGVQGLPQMMADEDYVVQHHLAQVISQSFAAAEESFGSTQSLMNLRYAFKDAAQNGVTVLGSAGDSGSANAQKQPVKNPQTIPFPTVEWPASDPLVTGVGGTYLCTDPNNPTTNPPTRTVVSGIPPTTCQNNPGVAEVAWIDSGGGFSHVFGTPAYQAGVSGIGSMRGVPDVGYQASSQTGVLTYMSLPGGGNGGLSCGSSGPCSSGWYDVGGTSSGSPQWAGLVAIAAQMHGGGLGQINPTLYAIGANPSKYAADFYDVTTGNNQADSSVPGYSATTGWDPVTGLGTPNAANLVPDLASP